MLTSILTNNAAKMNLLHEICLHEDITHMADQLAENSAEDMANNLIEEDTIKRNIHTLEEQYKNGYEIIPAANVINGKAVIDDYEKCAIAIACSELSRGGWGPQCMTIPLGRTELNW